MSPPNPARLAGALAAIFVLVSACGGEFGPEIQTSHYAYKHPPPSTPAPWTYVLTCYGGPSDSSAYLGTPACGGKVVDGQWWYSTGAYSFGCDSKLKLCANGKCVVVKVVDNGPAAWVESNAQATCGGTGYIIDASPLVTQHLFGLSCAGWSDCKQISVEPMPDTTPEGPISSPPPTPPPPSPPPSPPPECDPNSVNNMRQCNECGGQICQSNGTWATGCQPRPDLFPCPAPLSCDPQGWCTSTEPLPSPSPQPPPQCDPNGGNNMRRCNECGGQICQNNGTWATGCQPRPGLFPCPGGQTCNAQALCVADPSSSPSSPNNPGALPGPDGETSTSPPPGGADPWSDSSNVIEGGCSTTATPGGQGSLALAFLLLVGLRRSQRISR